MELFHVRALCVRVYVHFVVFLIQISISNQKMKSKIHEFYSHQRQTQNESFKAFAGFRKMVPREGQESTDFQFNCHQGARANGKQS